MKTKTSIPSVHSPWLVLLTVLMAVAVLVGCGSSRSDPTPTPTKTPVAMAGGGSANAAVPIQTETPAPAPTTPALPPPTPLAIPTPTPVPANIAPYTGLPVPAENQQWLNERPVLICVNNDAVGRSAHYGLSKADLVYEYIVDGFTVTRLTAIYQSQSAERVGPVRSARMPNIWMTYMYDGALACSGGSDEIRYLLKNEVGFPYLDADIDDPSNNVYFFSIGSDYRTRLQISTDGVRRWLSDTGKTKEWSRPGFQFNPEPGSDSAGSATTIRIPYPGGNNVEWRYDANTGTYARFQGGQPQSDPLTGKAIVAQNVIVMFAEHELTNIVEDSLGTKGVDIKLYGFGALRIFRDGLVYEGTWRANDQSPPRWLGPGEEVIPLKPGQSWVQVVRVDAQIDYQ